ncbi:hypothetical protein B0H14DRAFT_2555810 [Mycena olivaceomarginata]|nr:hypothetical protein B0H14DRAFT_2555810 [Mycena olivaceomarginata]
MLDKLANIPPATRALIRHARVSGDTLMLRLEGNHLLYLTYQALKLLGLVLDCLTVLGPRNHRGWKELHYLSHNSGFLASRPSGSPQLICQTRTTICVFRSPRAGNARWESAMGPAQGVNVDLPCYVAQPCSVLLQSTTCAGQDLTSFGREVDAALMAPGEREKEVLVVVWHGLGADYARGLALSRRQRYKYEKTSQARRGRKSRLSSLGIDLSKRRRTFRR